MSAKHSSPEYRRNAKLLRDQVRRAWKYGEVVYCWRGGHELEPGTSFDAGHLDPEGGDGRDNLAPECHRHNRSEGGRRGAAITNARRAQRPAAVPVGRPARVEQTRLAPW